MKTIHPADLLEVSTRLTTSRYATVRQQVGEAEARAMLQVAFDLQERAKHLVALAELLNPKMVDGRRRRAKLAAEARPTSKS